MRLFVAVVPPPDAVGSLDAAVGPVRAGNTALRWVPPERWHLTLAFLGEVNDRTAGDAAARFARAATRHEVLHLSFAGAGRFDGRVLWAGVTGQVDRLRKLAASVQAGARRAGVAVEERAYRPHLTLARARSPLDLRPMVAALSGYSGPAWSVDELVLMRSVLGPDPRYEVVAAWRLKGTVASEDEADMPRTFPGAS
ncbi:MAG: RNA 2',3'-cyclic phosphodiesterase [Actinomycetota bacterium]|nr:RNA 2',3'-cyclic phosphodiesterase [Actinomycetota bacterium]